MGGSKTTTNEVHDQTQTAAPPTWTLPGLTQVAGQVTNAASGLPQSHYTGPTTATYDPADIAAIQAAWGGAAQTAGQLAGVEQGMLPTLQSIGQGLNYTTSLPTANIHTAGMQDATAAINAAMDPAMRNLTNVILPGITNSALASGAYTSDRAMGVMPTEAIRNAEQTMQQTAATLGYQAYQDWAQRDLAAQEAQVQAQQANYGLDTSRQQSQAAAQLQALGMAPDMINSILHTQASSGDLLQMAANLGLTADQATINNAMGMDQYASQAPFMGLDTASALLAQLSGGWGTTTQHGTSTQTQEQSSDPFSQILQAAAGIGGMVAGVPGLGSMFGSAAHAAPAASSLFQPMPMPQMPSAFTAPITGWPVPTYQ